MKKFIYVFCKEDASKLINSGYQLLKYDDKGSIYIFVNKPDHDIHFSEGFMLTNTLTF